MSTDSPNAPSPGDCGKLDPAVNRIGFWANITQTIKHVAEASNSDAGKVRKEDYFTIILVPITSILLLVAVLSVGWARLLVSLLSLGTIFYYVLARIGIMRTLSERQAVLVWHILMATFLMGITFSFVYLEVANHFR